MVDFTLNKALEAASRMEKEGTVDVFVSSGGSMPSCYPQKHRKNNTRGSLK